MGTYTLTERELATMLAALRVLQHEHARHGDVPSYVADLVGEAGGVLALEEIDDLCETLSFSATTGPRTTKCCATCGSEAVLADCFADWDVDAQEWQVASIMDKGHYCEACEGECTIVDKETEE